MLKSESRPSFRGVCGRRTEGDVAIRRGASADGGFMGLCFRRTGDGGGMVEKRGLWRRIDCGGGSMLSVVAGVLEDRLTVERGGT